MGTEICNSKTAIDGEKLTKEKTNNAKKGWGVRDPSWVFENVYLLGYVLTITCPF